MSIDTDFTDYDPFSGEALWTIGEAGVLAAYDGWTSTPAAHVDAGLPAGLGSLWIADEIWSPVIRVDAAAAPAR